MANKWGESGTTWGQNSWGEQSDVNLTLTGVSATTSMGSVTVEDDIEVGWGRKTWGNLAWGDAYSIIPTGVEATSSVGSVTVGAGVGVSVTGVEATSAVGIARQASVYKAPTPVALTSAVGSVVYISDVIVSPTGVSATISTRADGTIDGLTAIAYSTVDKGDSITYTEVRKEAA